MKALKIIFGILAVIVMIVIVIGIFLPSEMKVERSINIHAQPSDIHPYVNDFRNWQKWTTWAKKDTNITNVYEGAEAGAGSIYKWSGNEEVGGGTLKMTKSDSTAGIWYDMSTEEGQFQSQGSITYEPLEDSTKVNWSYESDVGGNIVLKYVIVFFKPYIEHDFGEGLQGLKNLVESNTTITMPDSVLTN